MLLFLTRKIFAVSQNSCLYARHLPLPGGMV